MQPTFAYILTDLIYNFMSLRFQFFFAVNEISYGTLRFQTWQFCYPTFSPWNTLAIRLKLEDAKHIVNQMPLVMNSHYQWFSVLCAGVVDDADDADR